MTVVLFGKQIGEIYQDEVTSLLTSLSGEQEGSNVYESSVTSSISPLSSSDEVSYVVYWFSLGVSSLLLSNFSIVVTRAIPIKVGATSDLGFLQWSSNVSPIRAGSIESSLNFVTESYAVSSEDPLFTFSIWATVARVKTDISSIYAACNGQSQTETQAEAYFGIYDIFGIGISQTVTSNVDTFYDISDAFVFTQAFSSVQIFPTYVAASTVFSIGVGAVLQVSDSSNVHRIISGNLSSQAAFHSEWEAFINPNIVIGEAASTFILSSEAAYTSIQVLSGQASSTLPDFVVVISGEVSSIVVPSVYSESSFGVLTLFDSVFSDIIEGEGLPAYITGETWSALEFAASATSSVKHHRSFESIVPFSDGVSCNITSSCSAKSEIYVWQDSATIELESLLSSTLNQFAVALQATVFVAAESNFNVSSTISSIEWAKAESSIIITSRTEVSSIQLLASVESVCVIIDSIESSISQGLYFEEHVSDVLVGFYINQHSTKSFEVVSSGILIFYTLAIGEITSAEAAAQLIPCLADSNFFLHDLVECTVTPYVEKPVSQTIFVNAESVITFYSTLEIVYTGVIEVKSLVDWALVNVSSDATLTSAIFSTIAFQDWIDAIFTGYYAESEFTAQGILVDYPYDRMEAGTLLSFMSLSNKIIGSYHDVIVLPDGVYKIEDFEDAGHDPNALVIFDISDMLSSRVKWINKFFCDECPERVIMIVDGKKFQFQGNGVFIPLPKGLTGKDIKVGFKGMSKLEYVEMSYSELFRGKK